MNTLEQAPDFGMDFELGGDFDINAAFQEAITGVATDAELALEEKVRRMEVIVSEGTSEVYRDFVDFRQMAAQIEMMCGHDHALSQSLESSEGVSSFRDEHSPHDHDHASHALKSDDDEKDKKKKKDKKKSRGWLDALLKR